MVLVTVSGVEYEIELNGFSLNADDFNLSVNQQTVNVKLPGLDFRNLDLDVSGFHLYLLIDGKPYEVSLDRDFRRVEAGAGVFTVDLRDQESGQPLLRSGDGHLKAPIPGLVAKVLVAVGEQVEAGQPLLILEAMKMENEIRAPLSGWIKTLNVAPGQSVSQNELLAEIVE